MQGWCVLLSRHSLCCADVLLGPSLASVMAWPGCRRASSRSQARIHWSSRAKTLFGAGALKSGRWDLQAAVFQTRSN
ncbi:uncharacterized protein B0I36DRAFT_314178 [Microdochium trichocladiopsis]|uniref:Secreted protein n=1 Tax=Microdochium trichocladiopsis TaxID=1682393 RepID=A0A9P8YGG3_9PEZI|nr:uncharacterized protein B0I36DRAFT_314178 [Microdochium trichocladiopsis]KAH7037493.1 hypothetical protein B0I36DRAFT_314178 [Microdochium trichocladiopsis]